MGSYNQIGGSKMENFSGTPYHAKALELMAEEHNCRAEMQDLPVFSANDNDGEKKRRESLRTKLRSCCADWLRLESDVLRWRAKKIRTDDKMQKSLNESNLSKAYYPERERIEDIEHRSYELHGTKYHSKMVLLLSKYNSICSKIERMSGGKLTLSADSPMDKLENEKAKVVADIYKVKSDYLREQARKIKSEYKIGKGNDLVDELDKAILLLKGEPNVNSKSVYAGAMKLEVDAYRSRNRLAPKSDSFSDHPFSRIDDTISVMKSMELDLELDLYVEFE